MRKFILAALLSLGLCAPAPAVELVINYPNQTALVTLATVLGYYANGQLTTGGMIATGGAYAINNVGQVVATPGTYNYSTFPPTQLTAPVMAPGLYLRIRHNGDPALLTAQMTSTILSEAASLGVTIYSFSSSLNGGAGCWTADNVNCGPPYIATVGNFM